MGRFLERQDQFRQEDRKPMMEFIWQDSEVMLLDQEVHRKLQRIHEAKAASTILPAPVCIVQPPQHDAMVQNCSPYWTGSSLSAPSAVVSWHSGGEQDKELEYAGHTFCGHIAP